MCASRLQFVCAFCAEIFLRLLCLGVIKLLKVENTPSTPKERPLGNILDKWAKHSREPITKKDMIYYCNKMWTQYMLGSEERWPLNGSLNYYTISQLEMFCKRAGKRDKIPYVGAFMLLHQEEKESEGCHLMVQWSERKHKEKPVLRGKRKKK